MSDCDEAVFRSDAGVMVMNGSDLYSIHDSLLSIHGRQYWWPADTRFEILIGAVLTQNTSWGNVEQALANLRSESWMTAEAIERVPEDTLAAALRPSGYYNIKSRRLKNLCAWFLEQGGFAELDTRETPELRDGLLSIKGVGYETADDILLYAFERPVFVVDAYTRRLFSRVGLCEDDIGYEELRRKIETALEPDVGMFNEFHAVIVRHASRICKSRPLCNECPLRPDCGYSKI